MELRIEGKFIWCLKVCGENPKQYLRFGLTMPAQFAGVNVEGKIPFSLEYPSDLTVYTCIHNEAPRRIVEDKKRGYVCGYFMDAYKEEGIILS